MHRDEIGAYDLGLPLPIAPLEERRRGIPVDRRVTEQSR
jgi:hypothetical protein